MKTLPHRPEGAEAAGGLSTQRMIHKSRKRGINELASFPLKGPLDVFYLMLSLFVVHHLR